MGGRGQEQGADRVVELAAGAQPPDDVGDRDAAHPGQRDGALVLGGDAAVDADRVHRLAVRAGGQLEEPATAVTSATRSDSASTASTTPPSVRTACRARSTSAWWERARCATRRATPSV